MVDEFTSVVDRATGRSVARSTGRCIREQGFQDGSDEEGVIVIVIVIVICVIVIVTMHTLLLQW